MRRAIGVLAAVLALAPGAHSAPAPARLFVSAKEFSLVLSKQRLHPGTALIQLYNAGEDAHDLRLRRVGGQRALAVPEAEPGRLTQLRATLRSGTWKLWCSLPGHAAAGMRATLVVQH